MVDGATKGDATTCWFAGHGHIDMQGTQGMYAGVTGGIKCPVCSKFVLPDDIECHLVMCLTRPRLSYNVMGFSVEY
ncbi:hypothetical protein MSG28_004897 [Choristoneura fumiferana]|uniref:Uncharacterized protein n=1 Tax=Choristoneura fumiferana TaxID=7141 RepID=A0ACC0JP43_CHOFU|nr:hypothetical protein MSG28_004897 [Choristoneura fumiferana]